MLLTNIFMMVVVTLLSVTCTLALLDGDDCFDRSNSTNVPLFPREPDCGVSKCHTVSSRIKGGKEATLGEYPWMALVVVSYAPSWLKNWIDLKTQNCGGTIINNRYILTAGHCFLVEEDSSWSHFFSYDISGVTAYVGDWDTSTDPDVQGDKRAPPRRQVEVERVLFHPKHEIDRLWYDVALMRLKNKLTFNEFVKPICLPFGCEKELSTSFARTNVLQVGWGYYEDGNKLPNRLQKLLSTISRQDECKRTWAQYGHQIRDFQVCVAGNSNESPCAGDSGGPLMSVRARHQTTAECVHFQLGIVSFGINACNVHDENKDKVPKVNTWVPAILDWILEKVKE